MILKYAPKAQNIGSLTFDRKKLDQLLFMQEFLSRETTHRSFNSITWPFPNSRGHL